MAIEIERRFLVSTPDWQDVALQPQRLRQAYLAMTSDLVVRVRVVEGGPSVVTFKSANTGPVRLEFEYEIPEKDAEQLITLRTGNLIEKERHVVPQGDLCWEVDVFSGALSGLTIAEVELDSIDRQIDLPGWLGKEITEDGRYSNAALAMHGLPE